MIGVRRQTQIYLDGVSGRRPRVPLDANQLEMAAAQRMQPDAFAYVAAGAGNERTVAANRHHDARLALARPRGRVPAVPARQGDRPVHERPRVHRADQRGAARAARAAPAPDPGRAAYADRADSRLSRRLRRDVAVGAGSRRGPAVHRDLLAPVADLGDAHVPARAHEPPDLGHRPASEIGAESLVLAPGLATDGVLSAPAAL
jgi:hypothetical protein